ncbi:MAG: hypothetical protein ABMA13_19775 [Chthoniobacteraceae bacterium]
MKLTKLHLVLAIGAAMFTTSAIAGPGGKTPADLPTRVETKEQAMDCCKAKAKVALACMDCKSVEVGKDEKGILAWFAPDSKHGCSGCGGKITVTSGDKKGTSGTYKHVCSKCGPDSASVCTDHKKS